MLNWLCRVFNVPRVFRVFGVWGSKGFEVAAGMRWPCTNCENRAFGLGRLYLCIEWARKSFLQKMKCHISFGPAAGV